MYLKSNLPKSETKDDRNDNIANVVNSLKNSNANMKTLLQKLNNVR